jgi:hypothetical protein
MASPRSTCSETWTSGNASGADTTTISAPSIRSRPRPMWHHRHPRQVRARGDGGPGPPGLSPWYQTAVLHGDAQSAAKPAKVPCKKAAMCQEVAVAPGRVLAAPGDQGGRWGELGVGDHGVIGNRDRLETLSGWISNSVDVDDLDCLMLLQVVEIKIEICYSFF